MKYNTEHKKEFKKNSGMCGDLFTSPADTPTHMCKQTTTTSTAAAAAAKSSHFNCLLEYRELLKHASGKQVELDLFQMVNINPSEMTTIQD